MAYERKDIDRMEVLTLLGKMYAITATGKDRPMQVHSEGRRTEHHRQVHVHGKGDAADKTDNPR